MNIVAFVQELLASGMARPLVMPGVIILCTFVLEDATTMLVGVLAASGGIAPEVALASLMAGIALGDLGLYALGRLARLPRFGARIARHDRLLPLRDWLERSLVLATFTVRFLPGLRLPTYTATGFFGLPFYRFAATVTVATAIWTSALFAASYGFGTATADLLGAWRWPICLIPVAVLFLIGRRGRRAALGRADAGA